MYDQQREAYVQSVLARTLELEQQLAQAKQQQTKQEASPEGRKCGGGTELALLTIPLLFTTIIQ